MAGKFITQNRNTVDRTAALEVLLDFFWRRTIVDLYVTK